MTNPSGTTDLSPTALSGHLACAHLTQLERRRRAGELTVDLPRDPRLDALRARGLQHETDYVAGLQRQGRSVCDLRGQRQPAATLAAMQAGYGAIVQAALAGGGFVGVADVLLRVETSSALGAWSYEPADTKLARDTKAGTILQLCTYCDLLARLQGTTPAEFSVVTPLAEERYRTADFLAYFRRIRARLQTAVQATPPPTTYPVPVPHCEVCGYWQYCDARRRTDDHPSLVASIRGAHVRELQRQDITTLTALASSGGTLRDKPRRGSADTFVRLAAQAKLQVLARSRALPPVEPLPLEPGRGLSRLPEPSPGDVFLDFEGDPFVGAHGLEYLTGWSLDDDGTSYEQRWALGDACEDRELAGRTGEKAACEAFLDAVMERLHAHPDLHVFHFGAYEPAALKRLCARHATRGEELDRLLRGGRFVDLHAVVREGLRIGVERYGLKEMEPLHGFSRALDLRQAAAARRDLELKLEFGAAAEIDDALRARVAAYNRDDCLSTAALRRWLEERRRDLIEAGRAIPRPTPGDTEASDAVGERDERIAALQRALTASLPTRPAERSAEEHARGLLAATLGYFRQEEKNAWWEHFRLREVPGEERLEEREMLASLELASEEPRRPRQRNVRRCFRFPPQETAIDLGDKVLFTADEDPAGRDQLTSMTVDAIDLEAGTVVLSMNEVAAARNPSAVMREQVVGAGALEKALLSFAEHVRDHGFRPTARFQAARDLLLRAPPRLRTPGPLRRAGETTLGAAIRLCTDLEHGVLAVQGPPGAGKTYSGARAILALSRAGRRVGITAVSHKVIDNLLLAVRDAALEEGVSLRLVHKHKGTAPPGVDYVSAEQALAAIGPLTVVGGTAWLWASDDAQDGLDFLFVDEAGQMALAQALAAARAADNLVLLGDPQQLEQPTRGTHQDGADVAALVHVLGVGQATLRDEQGLFLDRTWRLHPSICAFTSDIYYDGRLQAVVGLDRQAIAGPTPFAGAGLFLVEVMHEDNRAQAEEEIEAVADVVASLLQPNTRWIDRHDRARPLTADDVLVVAPYNAQVSALQRRLAATGVHRVGTVDRFQGQEAPVVVYSCTSSTPQDAPRGMAFLYDPHRFNVATSRARGAVIVVASPALFEPDCHTPEQMRWANGLCAFRERAQVIASPRQRA